MVFFFWFLFAAAVGVYASNKGRSGFGWFLLSMLISPLLGLLFAAVSKNLAEEKRHAGLQPGWATHVKCSQCAEWVLPDARVCKHCRSPIEPVGDGVLQAMKNDKLTQQISRAAKKDRADLIAGVACIAFLFLVVWIISRFTG